VGETRLRATVILWAAGVAASPLGKKLGAPVDRAGRVLVQKDLSLPGHPEVFVIGDLAALKDENGKLLPGVAPVALQQGTYVAKLIRREIKSGQGTPSKLGAPLASFARSVDVAGIRPLTFGEAGDVEPRPPFHYWDKGSLATIGRAAAVAEFGKIHISGFIAWLAWLFVHILFLIGFRNRVLVFIQWAWSYVTYERGARLITGSTYLPGWSSVPPHSEPSTPEPQASAVVGSRSSENKSSQIEVRK
jgi:NADH dehydrogenase